jgi:hypothetical protein
MVALEVSLENEQTKENKKAQGWRCIPEGKPRK